MLPKRAQSSSQRVRKDPRRRGRGSGAQRLPLGRRRGSTCHRSRTWSCSAAGSSLAVPVRPDRDPSRDRIVLQAPAGCLGRKFSPAGDADFGEGVGQMRLHGSPADEQSFSDLGVGEPLRGELDDLEFGRREAGPAGGRALAGASGSRRVPDRGIDAEGLACGPGSLECVIVELLVGPGQVLFVVDACGRGAGPAGRVSDGLRGTEEAGGF